MFIRKTTHTFLGDVRDLGRLGIITRNVQIIFHLAAFKHVILSEYNPFDAVRTNVIGTQNIKKTLDYFLAVNKTQVTQ